MKAYFLTILLTTISLSSFAQGNITPKEIARKDFDKMVTKSIGVLNGTAMDKISDQEHINIMLCLNTIQVLGAKDIAGAYDELEVLADQKNYRLEIVKVYPDWVPNRGMGFYFLKLDMELGGTPSANAYYKIKDP